MRKRLLSWLLCAAIVLGLVPAMGVRALAAELEDVFTLQDDYISVSVSKKNGGFTVRTVEGDRLKKSDNNKDLLYHDGQYDTSFVSFRVDGKDYIFGGDYPKENSSEVTVTEANGSIQAVWSVAGLTFTQSLSLTNTSSNESGMVSLNLSAANASGKAVLVQARILYDTALGGQDYGYYHYTASDQSPKVVQQETVLTADIPDQLFATDDPYSPSIAAYTVTSGSVKPYQAAFGHWSHLASTLFDFEAVNTLDFTNTRSEYMTADSACALWFDLGNVAAGGSASLNTFYGVFSNHATPASDSVAINLTAPVRLTLDDAKDNFKSEAGAKGEAHFAVTVDFTNITGENAQDLTNLVLAVRSSGHLRSLTDDGKVATGQDFDTTTPYTFSYNELKVGESQTKTLYFQAKPDAEAAYERITIGVYQLDANGQLSETNKLGERMAYVLLPGSDNDVPKVNFASMTPKIIYTEGTRHLFVTVTNSDLLTDTGIWNLKAYSEDKKVSQEIPHENITIKDGVMDVALTEDIKLSEGGWYLQLEWTDAAVNAGVVTADKKLQTAPELHFTVSADKKYKNDAYGVLAVVEYDLGSGKSKYEIETFQDEAAFETFQKNETYEEILLIFKGEFTKRTENGKEHYVAASTKSSDATGKTTVDNPVVINGCMDFEGGSLEVYYAATDSSYGIGDICVEFDGELYTNTERTSIWKGEAIFTKIKQGERYSLIPYNENGERGSYEISQDGKKKLNTDAPQNFKDKPISLIWPDAAGIGQTLSGLIFKMAYGQLGVMYDTEDQTNKIEGTIGGVISFTGSMDLTFASGKVDATKAEDPTYWSKMKDFWKSYNDIKNEQSLFGYVDKAPAFERSLDWSEINEAGDPNNKKNIKGSVMVRDVLFGCGEGFVGVNFQVGVAIKNYISGLPEIEGTIAVNTINNWSFGIDGKIELATFTVEAKVSFKSKDNIPIPDELYVFVSGFEPGLNIDGCGVVWITGGGGGIKNIYDSIFMTQAVPPLKLMMSVSFDVLKVLTCQKATVSLGLTGISLQAEDIGVKAIPDLTAIQKMGFSLEWYPGIDLRANITLNLFQGVISGGGYIVLISPDYQDVFFEMFARAQLKVPASIPVVGGMQLAGIDLGLNSEKIWGALEVLFVTLGVTYYWGEGSVDFGSGSKTNPTFPDLLGYDDIPVYYDAENDQTLYARVGTNTQLMATTLPDDGGVTLMASSAWVKTDGNSKAKHQFDLGTYNDNKAIVQITFDAKDKADAETKAKDIKAGSTEGGNDYGLVGYNGSNLETANANLSYDDSSKKATYAFTATKSDQYDKTWYLTTPEGSDVLLYNVAEVPEVKTVSGTLNGSDIALNWTGSSLADLDQISFYLCESNHAESTDPGYRIDAVESNIGTSATLTIPADVPSGDYYVRAVYSKTDEVNGVVFSDQKITWTNSNTPGGVSFDAKTAGNLQYKLDIRPDSNTDGYLVTVYDAQGNATDFEQVSYEAAESGNTVIHVGGRYTAVDADGNTKEFGLIGGQTYTIGVTPYKTVKSGSGESAVLGKEVKSNAIQLPEMVTPTVTFSADKAKKTRTETDQSDKTKTVTKDVYTTNALTVTAVVSEAVTGTWRLDSEESSHAFSGKSVPIDRKDLAEGEHTLTLQGAAADGDSFAATYAFTVDTLPPQLLLSSPVNGSFFDKDGSLTLTGVTDADARFTILCDGETIRDARALSGSEFDAKTGTFSVKVDIPDPNGASQRTLSISVSDDVGNTTAPKTVEVSHGGLADLASLEIMVNGQTYSNGNVPVPVDGLKDAALTLVGVTSDGRKFKITGYNVVWDCKTVNGTASVDDGKLTAAAMSQGMLTGKLAVADGAYRTAVLSFGALTDHMVAVSGTIGGTITGGGEYEPGKTVTLTATPDSGYRFVRWNIVPTGLVSDPTAATITFTMPQSGNVSVEAVFEAIAPNPGGNGSSSGGTTGSALFRDIDKHWARESIEFCAARKIFNGVGDGRFDPDGSMTRAMFATTLYRLAGSPAVSGKNQFTDVPDGQWYSDAILWGQSNQILTGYGGGKFGPNDLVTREQMCALLMRYLTWAGKTLPVTAQAKTFADDKQIGDWARESVRYCQTHGLINGKPNNLFAPKANATRAENSTVFHRMILALEALEQ